MTASGVARLDGLPGNVATVLSAFLASARDALSDDLVSAVLFGSAAEGKLAPASDVNLLLVLRTFTPDKIGRMRDAFLTAEAAIKLRVMFVLEDEVASAAEFFAQKFADILRRHRIVFGKDVLGGRSSVARPAEVFRLRQILLNLVLRLREAYVARGHRPEQAALILADMFGPLRAACATLFELEGTPNSDSTAALAHGRRFVRRGVRRCGRAHTGGARPGDRGCGSRRTRYSRRSRSQCRFPGAPRGCREGGGDESIRSSRSPIPRVLCLVRDRCHRDALCRAQLLRSRVHLRRSSSSIRLLFACLRGGPKEVVRVATLGLIDRGLLRTTGPHPHARTEGHAGRSSAGRIEKEVLSYFDAPRRRGRGVAATVGAARGGGGVRRSAAPPIGSFRTPACCGCGSCSWIATLAALLARRRDQADDRGLRGRP